MSRLSSLSLCLLVYPCGYTQVGTNTNRRFQEKGKNNMIFVGQFIVHEAHYVTTLVCWLVVSTSCFSYSVLPFNILYVLAKILVHSTCARESACIVRWQQTKLNIIRSCTHCARFLKKGLGLCLLPVSCLGARGS